MTQVSPIPPASGKAAGLLVAIVLLMLGIAALFGWVAWSARHGRAEVTPEGLRLEEARVVDLRAEPDLQPRVRTMGTALGSYASGWLRLRNGEKALLYLTDRARVVYLPTRDGYSVLVSSHAPERLLSALRDAAGEGGAGHPREEPDTGTRGDRPT